MSLDRRLAVLDAVADTPVLVLDVDATQRNVDGMQAIATAGGKALRPHAKTHKMLEVARMQLAAGAAGLHVAKLGEAEVLLASGVEDLFIGYPIVGAGKIERLLTLAEQVRISLSLDDVLVAAPIARAAAARGLVIDVMLDINTGLDRTGVLPADAVALAQRVADLAGMRIKGVMTHEGQALPRSADEATLAAETAAACARMVETAEAIRAAGIDCREVSLGTTATARFDAQAPGVTEIRPGTYVFGDCTMAAHGAIPLEDTAVWAVATVVSRPSPDRAIVDAGSKVLSSDRINQKDAPPIVGRIVDRPDHMVVRVMEEHGIIATPPGSTLAIGDRVAIVPSHICTTINLADSVLVARDGAIVDEWRVAARGRVR
jgi:D-serine deaminase-like pyridoxal phosphate-dependent protein